MPDVIVYFLHHIEKADDEWLKAKTEGEMLDSQLAVEGLFFIALLFVAEELALFINQCWWHQSSQIAHGYVWGEMNNDWKLVDTIIREYWELNGGKEDEEH